MTDVVYLDRADILDLHRFCLDVAGGDTGIRDMHALESALHQPQATFGGRLLHPDLHLQAAAYLFHLVKNHPFVDGNKRIGTVAALAFLRLNGHLVTVDEKSLTDCVLGVVDGRHDKEAIATFLRRHSAAL